MFRASWGALSAGQDVNSVMLTTTSAALAACRLGGINARALGSAGLTPGEAADVLRRSYNEVAVSIDERLRGLMHPFIGQPLASGTAPGFAEALIRQPRAGATRPGKPRIMLEPPENHGDHCFIVAVLGAALAPHYGARSETAFLAGLAHHLHNAVLPDSGFAGEILLGAHLAPVIGRLSARELETLPPALRARTEAALATIPDASTAEGRAFHAADVIDRVLQLRHYEQVANFTIGQALEEMELVHAGPTQAFHQAVLQDAGLP